jgi:hypothetical protein
MYVSRKTPHPQWIEATSPKQRNEVLKAAGDSSNHDIQKVKFSEGVGRSRSIGTEISLNSLHMIKSHTLSSLKAESWQLRAKFFILLFLRPPFRNLNLRRMNAFSSLSAICQWSEATSREGGTKFPGPKRDCQLKKCFFRFFRFRHFSRSKKVLQKVKLSVTPSGSGDPDASGRFNSLPNAINPRVEMHLRLD